MTCNYYIIAYTKLHAALQVEIINFEVLNRVRVRCFMLYHEKESVCVVYTHGQVTAGCDVNYYIVLNQKKPYRCFQRQV